MNKGEKPAEKKKFQRKNEFASGPGVQSRTDGGEKKSPRTSA